MKGTKRKIVVVIQSIKILSHFRMVFMNRFPFQISAVKETAIVIACDNPIRNAGIASNIPVKRKNENSVSDAIPDCLNNPRNKDKIN